MAHFFLISLIVLLTDDNAIETALVKYDFIIRSIPGIPDGYPKVVISMHNADSSWDINRPFPGPLIRATLGDTLEIRIKNLMKEQSTTIHFHGLHMFENPWMDGTEMITQCPVHPHETFTHIFNVTQAGTFWYHSHNGQQYSDGLIGPIIIDRDSIEQRYSYGSNDHVIILQEWYHESWADIMTAYQGPYAAYNGCTPIYPWPPTALLLNGHGRFDCRTTDCNERLMWMNECNEYERVQCIPLRSPFFGTCDPNAHISDEFLCNGTQMRIRLINAASGIPFRFWIDQHNITIVARDSLEILPITVQYVTIAIGQRLDLIVQCNQDPTFKYEIFSTMPPNFIAGPTPPIWVSALFVYPQSNETKIPTMSPNNSLHLISDDVLFEFKHLKPIAPKQSERAIKRVKLFFSVIWSSMAGNALEEWQVNGITFEKPKEPLLQANFLDGSDKLALTDSRPGRLNNVHKTYIEYFEYGQVYEILMINDDPQQHPWHLHGYILDFIAAGTLENLTNRCNKSSVFDMKKYDFDSVLPLLNDTPTVLTSGDSFTVPKKGYVAFRFKADNPGPWFFHCHMDWHMSPGLALVFSVGINGTYKDLLQPPPKDFYACGSRQLWPSPKSSAVVHCQSIIKAVIFLIIFKTVNMAV
ncbi:unnamed protein product [Didymodactylos carnosus]|uniref:Uncharacterized protein n=1 Tax=Didymodactylos carnosus TaxID=1234261 RepID=A0A815GYK9_9BILA|nr:unnamed protein product [Didymodactylos carnosus]CAF1344710.1 unnamed protein product [Didymodactylos carnosus]CAF3742479.1 unnamed protein product [Didymodactylos carnosus]CAF4209293.1 unnamed protein product [Didymodactylos carnosus]